VKRDLTEEKRNLLYFLVILVVVSEEGIEGKVGARCGVKQRRVREWRTERNIFSP
jgi:hypothetical protein